MEAIARKSADVLDIAYVLSDRLCGGLDRATSLGLRAQCCRGDLFPTLAGLVRSEKVELILLAGFLSIVPPEVIDAMPPMLNIHPSLLPKYGGKGCYGEHVHRKVFAAGESFSGATVHRVAHAIDAGETILQSFVSIRDCADAEEIAARVLATEHELYDKAIRTFLRRRS